MHGKPAGWTAARIALDSRLYNQVENKGGSYEAESPREIETFSTLARVDRSATVPMRLNLHGRLKLFHAQQGQEEEAVPSQKARRDGRRHG